MNIIPTWYLILISVLVGLPRPFGMKHAIYQAIAHLWVGSLIGAAAVDSQRDRRLVCWWCVAGLSMLELACFLLL